MLLDWWHSDITVDIDIISARRYLSGFVKSARLVGVHSARAFPGKSDSSTLKSTSVEIISSINTTDRHGFI